MKKIQMVDLKSQYNKIQEEVDTAVLNVIKSTQYINGPEVKDFQKELEVYMGVKHVIPCANGTDALQISMMALDLKAGDEVITSDFTYVATAETIALLGLTPVLVDVYADTYDINIEDLERAITSKTKAIVPVHLFGQSANMEAIMGLAKKYNLHVIEDTAQAIGCDYFFKDGSKQKVGTIGAIGCTSFFPSKNLGCYGDGGAIFTNNDDLAVKLRQIANHGQSRQYIHDKIGVNSRLDSMQAAVLRIKLRHLDNYSAKRNNAADYYDQAFENHSKVKIPVRVSFSNHVFHQYTLQLIGVDRNKMREFLSERGVPAMIYYPIPLHLQEAYKDPRYLKGAFPVTEKLCDVVLSLPMQTELDNEQLNFITSTVIDFLKNN